MKRNSSQVHIAKDVEYRLHQWERDVFPLLTEVKPFCNDKFENWMGEHLENKPVLSSLRSQSGVGASFVKIGSCLHMIQFKFKRVVGLLADTWIKDICKNETWCAEGMFQCSLITNVNEEEAKENVESCVKPELFRLSFRFCLSDMSYID